MLDALSPHEFEGPVARTHQPLQRCRLHQPDTGARCSCDKPAVAKVRIDGHHGAPYYYVCPDAIAALGLHRTSLVPLYDELDARAADGNR
jgi:hypothetical protein